MTKVRRDKNLNNLGTQNIITDSISATNIVADSITATSANIPAGTILKAQLSSGLSITAQPNNVPTVTATINTDYLGNPFVGNNFIITGVISGIQPEGPETGSSVILVIQSPDITGGLGGATNSIIQLAGPYKDAGGIVSEQKETSTGENPPKPSYYTNNDGEIQLKLSIPTLSSAPTGGFTYDFTLFVSTFDLDIATV